MPLGRRLRRVPTTALLLLLLMLLPDSTSASLATETCESDKECLEGEGRLMPRDSRS